MTTPVDHPKTAPSDTASRRGADWIIDQMEPDGSIRGATSINDYYKTVVGLAAAGRPHEADLMLDYVVQRFLQRDGDLDGSGCPFFDRYRIYAHAWVLMAGVLRARFDVIHPIVEFLAQFQDEETGGFYGSKPQFDRRGEQEMMTTGVVAIALLWAGRLDLALQTGQWMKRLFDAQPDLSQGLYCVWDRQQGLVTDFPSEDASMYLVDSGKPVQFYFQYGIAAALLSSLYGATRDAAWLELARAYLHASSHCQDDVYREPQSGKIGWGAAWTYRLSRDEEDRRILETVAVNLEATQMAAGGWANVNVYDREATEDLKPSIDATAEFVAHFSWMESALRL